MYGFWYYSSPAYPWHARRRHDRRFVAILPRMISLRESDIQFSRYKKEPIFGSEALGINVPCFHNLQIIGSFFQPLADSYLILYRKTGPINKPVV